MSHLRRLCAASARASLTKLENLGITSVNGLLRHYPSRHLTVTSVSELDSAQEIAIIGTVWSVNRRGFGRGQQLQATEAVVGDATGNVQVVWFNQPYVARYVNANDRILVSGVLPRIPRQANARRQTTSRSCRTPPRLYLPAA